MPAVTPGTLRAIGTIGARRGAGASARKWADKRRWIPSEVIHQIMCDGIHITDALIYAATQLAEHGHGEVDNINVAQLMRDAAARIDLMHEMLDKARAEAEHKIAVLEGELRSRPLAPPKPVVIVEHVQVGDLKAGDVIKSGSERWRLRETPRRIGNGRVALQVDMNKQRPSLRASRKSFRQETVFLVERIQHT